MTLFRELIQVSIGSKVCLSRTPNEAEWGELYQMAKKQSLVGVCFAGVQKLQLQQQEPPEMLYLTWMGMAAKIQQRNEVVNRQCVELQARLSADGFRSCILKGQGVAQVYPEPLRGLRQSGDIDIWVEGSMEYTLGWAKKLGVEIEHIDINHAPMKFYEDTEVEVHFIPSLLHNPFNNKFIQRYFTSEAGKQFDNFDEKICFSYPLPGFNLVFSLLHIYRHQFSSGIGLRQIMDYYFILMASSDNDRRNAMTIIASSGMKKFAGALMHVMKVVFGLDESKMLCSPIAEEGMKLLDEIMLSGNFGHGDTRFDYKGADSRFHNGWVYFKKNLRNILVYPQEVLWSPFWKLWHYCWRKRKGYL